MDIGDFSVDVFVVCVVLVSFIIGWIRGATREILSVVSWIGAVYFTIWAFPHAKSIARDYISHGLIADFLTSCVLFIVFLTLLSLLNYFFSNIVRKSVLNTPDKALGGIFGITRGLVVLAMIDIVLMQCFMSEVPEWISKSKTYPVVSSISNFLILVLPNSVQGRILSHMSLFKKQTLMNFVKDNVFSNIGVSGKDLLDNSVVNKIVAEKDNQDDSEQLFGLELSEEPDTTKTDNDKKNKQTATDLATLKPKKNSEDHKNEEVKIDSKTNKRIKMDLDRFLEQSGINAASE
ncbi:MAG: CvpA family protein [Holosporales bacterium]|jgi:membrane protein required for colicin V production|nr:CvpA family protein [Holosporales bacterium]